MEHKEPITTVTQRVRAELPYDNVTTIQFNTDSQDADIQQHLESVQSWI
jgi:hypothetical protein